MTPVHITKRALAVVGGRDQTLERSYTSACDVAGPQLLEDARDRLIATLHRVTCPACLVLLDAELEGRGAEAQRLKAEIEAERIATATDDELLAEAVGRGEDPEATRKRVQDLLREAVAKHRAEIEAGR